MPGVILADIVMPELFVTLALVARVGLVGLVYLHVRLNLILNPYHSLSINIQGTASVYLFLYFLYIVLIFYNIYSFNIATILYNYLHLAARNEQTSNASHP